MSKTMLYAIISSTHVAVHSTISPSDEEWQAYLEDIRGSLRLINGILVYTLGGGPSATQRTMANKFWEKQERRPKIVILTSSTAVRGMATALNWFLKTPINMFSLEDFGGAFDCLGTHPAQRDPVMKLVRQFLQEFGH